MSSKIYNMSSKIYKLTEKQIYLKTGVLPYKMFITVDGKFICNRHGCNFLDYPDIMPECECMCCQKNFINCNCKEFCSCCAS